MAVVVGVALRRVAERVALVRRGPADGHPWWWPDRTAVEVIREADDGERHPLWGVASALRAARTPLALVVPCDVPTLAASTIQSLASFGGPVVVRDPDRLHPLLGVFVAADAGRAEELAAAGDPVRSFVAPYATVSVDEMVPNVNRATDVLDRLDDLARLFAPLEGANLQRALEAEAVRRLADRGAWISGGAGEDR